MRSASATPLWCLTVRSTSWVWFWRHTRHGGGLHNPQANSWQPVASMPRRLCYHAAAMGGKIYVTGEVGAMEGMTAAGGTP